MVGMLSKFNEANRHHYMHASMAVALIMLGASRMMTISDVQSRFGFHMLLVLLELIRICESIVQACSS